MATEQRADSTTELEDVMDDIRHELVRRVAAADRDENREIFDALEIE